MQQLRTALGFICIIIGDEKLNMTNFYIILYVKLTPHLSSPSGHRGREGVEFCGCVGREIEFIDKWEAHGLDEIWK